VPVPVLLAGQSDVKLDAPAMASQLFSSRQVS
jgi:hypothetical protein